MSLRYKFIIAFVILTIPVLFLGGISIYILNHLAVPLREDIPKNIQQLADSSTLGKKAFLIQYYDEVLTQSARNYALTGDMKWKTRYEEDAPKLDAVIKDAIAHGDAGDKKIFSSIEAANFTLVNMEEESMTLAGKEDLKGAITILESPEYASQKQIYQVGLTSFATKKGVALDTAVLESAKTLEDITTHTESLITTSMIQISSIVVGIFLFAFLLALYIGNGLITPLITLKNQAKLVAGGMFEGNLPVQSHDELGQLSEAFNTMIAAVKESRSDVDRKVLEQTGEITEKSRQMEDQQKAILNILEDVEKEKKQVTVEKVKYEGLLTSIADGIIATDQEGKIILINQAGTVMLGWNNKEIVGKKLIDRIPVVDQYGQQISENLRPVTIAMTRRKPFVTSVDTSYYYVRKDKTKIPVALTAAPIILNNELIGVIDVFRDVTHEKEVDRMKTEFISLASHQLRTPLSAMKWFGEMLLAGDAGTLNNEQKEMVENIYASNERMVELVNSLLNISRIESGRLVIDPKPTDVVTLVKNVISELKMKFEEKQQTCIVSINENLPLVSLDPKLIRQVYMNLLTNSNKYTDKGGEIHVFLSKNDTDLISQISDNGFGIPKEDQGRVFQKFFRAPNILKLETEGTGLGLYLIKSIIDSSGGKIWFESESGRGTTFWFSIPLSGMTTKKGEVGLEEKIMMGVRGVIKHSDGL